MSEMKRKNYLKEEKNSINSARIHFKKNVTLHDKFGEGLCRACTLI